MGRNFIAFAFPVCGNNYLDQFKRYVTGVVVQCNNTSGQYPKIDVGISGRGSLPLCFRNASAFCCFTVFSLES